VGKGAVLNCEEKQFLFAEVGKLEFLGYVKVCQCQSRFRVMMMTTIECDCREELPYLISSGLRI
jgi:hypothetical protein